MKKRKLTILSLSLLAMSSLLLINCTKDNEAQQVMVIDRPNINRTINYTVLVVAGETSSTNGSTSKSAIETTGAQGATVEVAVNGTVISKTTDASGQATFTSLTAGLGAVTVSLANHTTVNYIVNLYHIDTLHYDNESSRISATKVVVFPTSGNGMITVSGVVKMRTNIEVTFPSWVTGGDTTVYLINTPQYVPSGTTITAEVTRSELGKYVTMLDGGGILTDVTYEGLTFTGATDANGAYSISVPSTAMGLSIDVYHPALAATVTYSAYTYTNTGAISVIPSSGNYNLVQKTTRYVFASSSSTIKAYSGINEVLDIDYPLPVISDKDHIGVMP